jgi:hypothetical protein
MNLKINHIIELLESVNTFVCDKSEKKIKQDQIIKYLKSKKISKGTNYLNYEDAKKFCLDAKILKLEKDYFTISKIGFELIKNTSNLQKFNLIIIEKCFTNNYFKNILINILEKFQNNTKNQLWCEKIEIYDLFKKTNLLQILYDVEFLQENHLEKIIINQNYVQNYLITQTIKSKRKQSQSDIDKSLLAQKKVGQIAEKIVLEYERERLKKINCLKKSNNVEQISDEWANKGYDIESFNDQESYDEIPDRFIEVKGTTGKKFSIFWSENEIKTAKEIGDRYWIYFVPEIDTQTESSPVSPEIIQNPFQKIKPYSENLSNDEFVKSVKSFHIEKND